MQKETSNLRTAHLQENVLLKNACLRQYHRAHNLVGQAKYHAKKIISDAHQEADAVRQQAYQNGYEQGLLMAIETATVLIDGKYRLVNEVYLQLRDEVKVLLMESVNQESLITRLFENWADSLDKKDEGTPFHLLLPVGCRQFKRKLKEYIHATHQGGAVFEFHHDSRYVFKYREQLVEFSPEVFVDNHVESLLRQKDLYHGCNALSEEALTVLHRLIEQYYPLSQAVMPEDNPEEGVDTDENH